VGTLVEAIGLSRRFGETEAVRELSFSVEAGALFGIVGPDGAGKTTTLRMLAGVLRPTGGDARVDGVSVVSDPERIKHGTAYMPQRFGLYTDLTIQENIAFYADLYRVPQAERPARLERLYQFSRLGQFKTRLAGQLSGGMKQKLALCCALIHQPRLLLLDEPTFGVDPISRRDLWLILHQMVAEGVTAIVSTAYLDEAERCDQVVLLDGGKAVALDTPEALQASLSGEMLEVRTHNPRQAARLLTGRPGVTGVSASATRCTSVLDPLRPTGPRG
jgi:ABC-2 type transport system ATP-binding protein